MKISHVLNHLAAPTEFTCDKCNCIAVKQEKRGLVSSSNRFLARESTFTKPEKFSGCAKFERLNLREDKGIRVNALI